MVKQYIHNAKHLEQELEWLAEVIRLRYIRHREGGKPINIETLKAPSLLRDTSIYKTIIREFKMGNAERIVLLLALVPHIAPYFIDDVVVELNGKKADHTLGIRNGTVPTPDLALFILAGSNLELRFRYQQIFEPDSFLYRNSILVNEMESGLPQMQQPLHISQEYLWLLTTGKAYKPAFTMSFPAKKLNTQLNWEDLVLNHNTNEQVLEIQSWIRHGKTLLNEWELNKRLSPGYKVLFFGPPGTGKTLTASLIGKDTGLDVYRIDLSMVVSKFIGETEKNLSRIFDGAYNKDWILFFDEAEALFGKRTEIQDAHSRYANQEVSYLLQKIEDHNGVVILSSNLKSNIDDAFTRRFQNMIYFPMPAVEERMQLWEKGFSKKSVLAKEVSIQHLATQYTLSGGAIMNVIRYASLKTLERKKNAIQLKDLVKGIMREYAKEGRTI